MALLEPSQPALPLACIAPDWVMVGATMDDGRVVLLASAELGRATLTRVLNRERESFRMAPSGRLEPLPVEGMTLDVLVGQYVWVVGSDYADALRYLFAQWSPDKRDGIPRLLIRNREPS